MFSMTFYYTMGKILQLNNKEIIIIVVVVIYLFIKCICEESVHILKKNQSFNVVGA